MLVLHTPQPHVLTGLDLMQTELIARSATIALVDVTVGSAARPALPRLRDVQTRLQTRLQAKNLEPQFEAVAAAIAAIESAKSEGAPSRE